MCAWSCPLSFLRHECNAIHSTNTIVKFADDTTIVGLITDDEEACYLEEFKHLTEWCLKNNLVLHQDKGNPHGHHGSRKTTHSPLYINGKEVDIVKNLKYLGLDLT